MAVKFDPKKSALIIQDLQNDVIMRGGAFATTPARRRTRRSRTSSRNVKAIAAAARDAGHARDPRLVHRREGRAGAEAERAALPGRRGLGRRRSRDLGRGPGEGPRAEEGRPRRREDAHERVPRHEPRQPAAGARDRDARDHGRLDELLHRAHGAPRRRRRLQRRSSSRTAPRRSTTSGTTPPSTTRCRTSPSACRPTRRPRRAEARRAQACGAEERP